MFELQRQAAKLADVNIRAECHGDEKVPACDLRLTFNAPNDFLSEFHPALKGSFYRAPDASDSQSDMLADQPGYSPSIRFQHIGPVKWTQQFAGYSLVIHWGVSGKDDILLDGCEVNKVTFDCKDGGTVAVGLRIQATPDEHALGRIGSLVGQDVDVTLTPPEA